ncbi:MAG: hypothetical protein ISR93_09315 [SAR324 cluster bacterium]|nr:hypothetical protein [SAR324 cluster bacterium]
MYRKYSLMLLLFALLTFPLAGSSPARTGPNAIKTSFTLGPAVLPMPGIRFQYRLNNYLSLNSGLSYILAAGDFNAGIYFHLPLSSINPYLGARKLFIFHLTGELNLNAGVVGFETENYFVEAGMGFGQEKTDFGNTQTKLAILQVGWLF